MNINFFNKAAKAAKLSDFNRYHVGCVVAYKNHILSVGFNSYKTHPIQKIYNKERYEDDDTPHSLHAEICALCLIKNRNDIDWHNIDLYIVRKNKKNENRLAKPCKSCMKMIQDLGIRTVYYTTNNGYARYNVLNDEEYSIYL